MTARFDGMVLHMNVPGIGQSGANICEIRVNSFALEKLLVKREPEESFSRPMVFDFKFP